MSDISTSSGRQAGVDFGISSPAPSFMHRPNPFATPPLSSRPSCPPSVRGSSSSSIVDSFGSKPNEWFRSRRVARRTKENRRVVKKTASDRWLFWIPFVGFLMGLAICGVLVYFGLDTNNAYTYTLVLDEDFSSGVLDPKIWTLEQEVGGFGNQQFDETTGSSDNIFIKDGQLYIQPTRQDASLIEHNSIINLTATGACTSVPQVWYNCVAATNTTNGTIVPPARSGRINTKKGASIKYGRVEVTAKISQGDWLWPAIWMLPVAETYGPWPQSGEIDILESRGNNHTYAPGGNNIASSTLHYGPDPEDDAYLTATNTQSAPHSEYGDEFHVYGLEWTPDHIFTYIDSRLLQVLYIDINQPFWNRGHFPPSTQNGTLITDPWASSPDKSAPFNENFYLILNVGVGGQNGWFPDGDSDKPWVNASPYAKEDFWNAQDQWYPTWKDNSAMIIKRVQMWQQDA